ncbi:hypothetical protein HK096_008376, partial [Nowakowskiella sp. JEL0078]
MNQPSSHVSTSAPVGELARQTPDRNAKGKKILPSIPLYLIMVAFIIVVLSLAIIPTCVNVFTSAKISVKELGDKILKSSILHLNSDLKNALLPAYTLTNTYTKLDVVRNLLAEKTVGYGNDTDLIWATDVILRNTAVNVAVACEQKYNLTGNVPSQGHPLNFYVQQIGTGGETSVAYCDYANKTNCFVELFDPGKNLQLFTPNFADTCLKDTKRLLSYSCDDSGIWKTQMSSGEGFFSYAKCAPKNAKGEVPFVCAGAFEVSSKLSEIFQKLSPTENSRVYLTLKTGEVVATNLKINDMPIVNENKTAF